LDDHVNRRALTPPGREAPLPHRLHRAIVQASAEPLEDAHVADRAIPPHDDLEQDLASDVSLPRLLGVVGLHLAEQPRRLAAAAAAGPVRAAPRAAARTGPDAASAAFAEASPPAGAGATARAGPVALGVCRRLRQYADAVPRIGRRRDDRRDHDRQLLGFEGRL